MTWLLVGFGGAVGAIARHGVNVLTARWMGFASTVPYSTAIVNVSGCAVIGFLAGALATAQIRLSAEARTFIFVGVLGGFTTFSSLGLDTLNLVTEGHVTQAVTNVGLQVFLGLGSAFAGYALAHAK
jgi:CrcB protein